MLKKTVLFSLLLFLPLFGQDKNQELSSQFRKGFDFYFINGFGVAYKFGSCGSVGYRLELDLGLSFSDGTENNNYGQMGGSKSNNDGDISRFGLSIRLSPQIYFNLYSSERITLNYGVGPLLKYSYSKNTYVYDNTNEGQNFQTNDKYTDTNKDNNYYLGLGAYISVEGKITDNVSLYAESSIGAGKAWEKTTNTSEHTAYNYKSEVNINRWFFSLNNIRIGASLYF